VESVYSTDKDMYRSPATTLEELRKQQKEKSLKSYHTIEPQHVALSSPLGEGEFGAVYKGVWMSGDGSIEVAVKTLHDKEGKSAVGRDGQVELLKEAAVMGQFSHTNVVALYGVVDTTDTVSKTIFLCSVHTNEVEVYNKLVYLIMDIDSTCSTNK